MIALGPGPTAIREILKEIVFLRSFRAFEKAESMVMNAVQLLEKSVRGRVVHFVAPIPGRDTLDRGLTSCPRQAVRLPSRPGTCASHPET
jgi:hypothetical protein